MFFLRIILQDHGNKLSRVEFDVLVKSYEQAHGIVLSIPNTLTAHLLVIEGDNVKIQSLEYYKPVIDHWDDFRFLAFFFDKVYRGERSLIISKEKLEAIYCAHKKNYEQTPFLEDLLVFGLASATHGVYILTLFKGQYCTDNTIDEADALLWEKLKNQMPNASDKEILQFWCRKITLSSGHHKCDVYKFLSAESQNLFNKAAAQLIVEEPDLGEGSEEYRKALLDHYLDRELRRVNATEQVDSNEFSKVDTDAFDTLRMISSAQRWLGDDYLYFGQSCRETLSFLIGQIVKSHTCECRNLDRINELTTDIQHKPYLVWTLCFWIGHWRPELLPALMQNAVLCSAMFQITKNLEITSYIFDEKDDIKARIAIELFRHLLDIIRTAPSECNQQNAKVVFDCLLATTKPQYFLHRQNPQDQYKAQAAAKDLSNNIRQILSGTPEYEGSFYSEVRKQSRYYRQLLKHLVEHLNRFTEYNLLNNRTISFDYVRLDLLQYILELSRLR